MTPLFIETQPGRYINATLVTDVIPNTTGGCNLYVLQDTSCTEAPYSSQEFVARVNNALALMQMVERAAT